MGTPCSNTRKTRKNNEKHNYTPCGLVIIIAHLYNNFFFDIDTLLCSIGLEYVKKINPGSRFSLLNQSGPPNYSGLQTT